MNTLKLGRCRIGVGCYLGDERAIEQHDFVDHYCQSGVQEQLDLACLAHDSSLTFPAAFRPSQMPFAVKLAMHRCLFLRNAG
jgi:hypothetical protein